MCDASTSRTVLNGWAETATGTPKGERSHLSVGPALDAVASAYLFEERHTHAEFFRHFLHWEVKVRLQGCQIQLRFRTIRHPRLRHRSPRDAI